MLKLGGSAFTPARQPSCEIQGPWPSPTTHLLCTSFNWGHPAVYYTGIKFLYAELAFLGSIMEFAHCAGA